MVTPRKREALLAEHGLTEDEYGFGLTLRGLQRGLRRAYELREQGNVECGQILALDAADERRAWLALAIQLEAFHEELQQFQGYP
ncbi:hypothetical protein ABZX65_26120 [Streptomyces sp. NPDC003300]|uniref:hypothetical protein n=1 Tax=unclassified Streptomyces TaxID=2593676 RepID=UPI0033B979F5